MARPRGFIDWKPRPTTVALIADVQHVLHAYRAYLPLTIRQIFYRLVATRGYDKTEKAYSRLAESITMARRARVLDFDAIRDDGNTETTPPGWSSQDDFVDSVRHWAKQYSLRADLGQPVRTILYCEAAGMVPQLQAVADRYGIAVMSAGGFDSVTGKHSLAYDIAFHNRPTRILHIGDYDPSGVHIASALEQDLDAFLFGFEAPEGQLWFERIIVTEEQIAAYSLPTAPAKATDNRSFAGIGGDGTSTVQAEALDPADLAAIVDAAIRQEWDVSIADEVLARAEEERALLQKWLSRKVI